MDLSSVYPAHCAQDGHYIHFLLFVQLHSFPPQQVEKLAAGFGPALQAHLSLVFQDLHVRPQAQRAGDSGSEDPECLSTAKASGSGDQPRELFQVLLQSQDQGAPCRFLRRQSLLQRCPTLAVIAACPQGAEPLACLCVWVLTSVDDVTAGEATTHLIEPAQHTEWTLQDLSIIWKTLLGRGQVRPLLQGFQLFLKDCPLVLMLSMFDLCCDYRNFSEAKEKLLDFQRTLITLRTSGSVSSTLLPLPWVEAQASVLLLTLLERCSSRYDLHHLLQLLADVDVLFKSNGPDFRMLSQLSQLLQDSDLTLSPRLLQCTSPSVQQEEFQATVDALQARGRYTQARQVAELAGLPKYNMVALCFSMRREIGENHEMAARTQLKMIESQPWGEVVTADLISSLVKVLALLKDAAESFSKDWCVRQATRCVRTAKLVSLQLHFLNQGSDVRVINLRPAELDSLFFSTQVFVVSEAYSYSPDWAEILHQKVVLKGDFVFLEELRRHRPLTSSLFEDVFKKLDSAPSSVTPNVKRLLSYCDDVYTRYRLAYQRSLNDVAENLLQDVKTSNYLNDRLSS
uniref:SPG11 vesicle trafficking associated, spatacsin n=1 Tax=Cynoglossus semilaevis TaxID=244447 RepID=A0A3P8X6E9_CYNSE